MLLNLFFLYDCTVTPLKFIMYYELNYVSGVIIFKQPKVQKHCDSPIRKEYNYIILYKLTIYLDI